MRKIFVESKVISAGDFDLCWRTPDLSAAQKDVVEPFIQLLNDKGLFLWTSPSSCWRTNRARPFCRLTVMTWTWICCAAFRRRFAGDGAWLPFDRMSKSILVATANPFNQQAAKELAEATSHRLLWYLTTPAELVQTIRKAFR